MWLVGSLLRLVVKQMESLLLKLGQYRCTAEDHDVSDQGRDEGNIESVMQGGKQMEDYEHDMEDGVLNHKDHHFDDDNIDDC